MEDFSLSLSCSLSFVSYKESSIFMKIFFLHEFEEEEKKSEFIFFSKDDPQKEMKLKEGEKSNSRKHDNDVTMTMGELIISWPEAK